MKNCKVIEDLLPNYIEHLTSQETNEYIEKHLAQCTKCTKIFKNMSSKTEEVEVFDQEEEINFLKRLGRKTKILKSILLIIVLVYIILIGRRTLIMIQLSQLAQLNKEISNYHSILHTYQDNMLITTETYYKETDYLMTMIAYSNNSPIKKVTFYKKGNEAFSLTEANGEKILNNLDVEEMNLQISSPLTYVSNGLLENLRYALFVGIESTYCNGKECYLLKGQNLDSYIDKDTGLVVRSIDKSTRTINSVVDYEYQFNVVQDDDIVKPDSFNS